MKKLFVMFLVLFTGCSAFMRSQHEEFFEPENKLLLWHVRGKTELATFGTEKFVNNGLIPLKVFIDPSLQPYYDAINQAIEDMNDRVGCTVLELAKDKAPDVKIVLGELGNNYKPGALTTGENIGLPDQTARIEIFGAVATTEVYLNTYHEFGHVFGLAHDYRSHSIMSPHINMWSKLPRPHLSDRQADALNKLYCR